MFELISGYNQSFGGTDTLKSDHRNHKKELILRRQDRMRMERHFYSERKVNRQISKAKDVAVFLVTNHNYTRVFHWPGMSLLLA